MWQRNHLQNVQDIQMSEFVNFDLFPNVNIPYALDLKNIYSIPEPSYSLRYPELNPWSASAHPWNDLSRTHSPPSRPVEPNRLSSYWPVNDFTKIENYEPDTWTEDRWCGHDASQRKYTPNAGAWVTFNQL